MFWIITEQQKNARNKIGDKEDHVLVFGIHRYKGQDRSFYKPEAPDEHLNKSPFVFNRIWCP